MKIGLVRRGFSKTGGAENYLKRFAAALTATGHTSVLFASAEWPCGEWPFGELRAVPGKSPRSFAEALAALHPREQCDFLFSLERIWSCDCYRAGDGVHRVALAQRAHFEPGLRTWFRQFNRTHRELLGLEAQLFSANGARTIIANSQMVKDEIVREYGFPAEKIAVIYNGLPAEKLQPPAVNREQARAALDLAGDEFVALFAGSGWERKGLRFAMQAIEQMPDAALLVAGRGSQRSLPRAQRTRFLGAVENLASLFAASDVFVLPTVYEPFSNACLEAAAAGLPVVTTKFNGFAEIMEPAMRTALVQKPDDIHAWIRALEFFRDSARRAESVFALQSFAREFTIERNLEKTLAWFCKHAV